MVFTSPTFIDYENATLLAFERQKLSAFNHHLKIAPHIASHIDVQIGLYRGVPVGTQEQFDNAIYVRLVGNATFCSQVKCFSHYPRGQTCTQTQDPFVFKSGNSDIEACHSSCFNLYEGAKDEEGNLYKAPLTHYSDAQQCCLMHNDVFYRLGIDDYMRTDAHTTPRVDTIGTGYDLDKDMATDSDGNEYFKFRLNKYYCNDFKYEFRDGECKPSVGELIFGTLVSTNLYKGIQYAGKAGGVSGVSRPSLPAITTPNPPTLAQWKSKVNAGAHFFDLNITLRMLGITRELSHLYFTTEFGWPGRLVEPLLIYTEIRAPGAIHIDFSAASKRLPQFRLLKDGRRQFDEYELIGSYDALRRANALIQEGLTEDAELAPNAIADLWATLSNSIATPEFWADIGLLFTDTYISLLKRSAGVLQVHFERMTASMILLAQKTIFNNIITKAGAITLKFSSIAFRLLATTFKALSVVGTIVNILGLADIALLGTDLFNLRNLVGQAYVDAAYNLPDLNSNELAYGYKSVEFSPAYYFAIYDTLVKDTNEDSEQLMEADNLILLPNATAPSVPYAIDKSLVAKKYALGNNILWEAQYLDRLVVNSDGIPINWHESKGKTFREFDEMVDNIKFVPHTFIGYKNYTSDMISRVEVTSYMVVATITIALVGGIFKNTILIFLALFVGILTFAFTISPNVINDLRKYNATEGNQ